MQCSGSQADCTLLCRNSQDCSLQCNPASVIDCPNAHVCGRSCP
jgi:hypothetical protein